MKRSFFIARKFLVWLVIAVLPMQGFAAASKMSCASVHASGKMSMLQFAQAAEETAHLSGMHHAHGMHETHTHQAHASDTATSASSQQPAPDQSGITAAEHGHCSACAACCAGAVAPPSTRSDIPLPVVSEAFAALPRILAVSHLSPGLERPPRIPSI